MLTVLSKDRVLCSDGDVDQPLRRSISYFCKSPCSQTHTVSLIWTDADLRLAQHFHIHLFLFLYGTVYVRLGSVLDTHLLCSSVLQLVARDAQRPQGNSRESARQP